MGFCISSFEEESLHRQPHQVTSVQLESGSVFFLRGAMGKGVLHTSPLGKGVLHRILDQFF